MAEDKRTAPGEKPRRRPAPTIDLKATEVEAAKPAETGQAPHDTAGPAPGAPQASVPPPQNPALKYAAFGGALGAVLLIGLGALWVAGVLPSGGSDTTRLDARLAGLETQI